MARLEEGAVFEALNLAALWKLPVVFLCENNTTEALGAAAGGYPASVIAATDLGEIARSVGVPAVKVDGTDSAAVFEAARDAVARARAGGGPTFVDAIVARWPGSNPLWPALPAGRNRAALHMGTPNRRRPRWLGWYREQDGVLRYARELLAAQIVDRQTLEAIDASMRELVTESVRFALDSPLPDAAAAFTDVFAAARPVRPAPPARRTPAGAS